MSLARTGRIVAGVALVGLLSGERWAFADMTTASAAATTATNTGSATTTGTATADTTAPVASSTTATVALAAANIALGTTATVSAAAPTTPSTITRDDTPIPARFNEAPELAERVAKGELPSVKERLPERPAVVEPVDRIGQYGGTWRKLGASVSDLQLAYRLGYEPLVRWARDGKTVIPGVAESFEMKDDGKTFVFHLRKGMKWSDGHPLTSADFVFTMDEILKYPGFSILGLPWLRVDNELPVIEAPDDFTVIYKFPKPYGNFPKGIAASGLQHDFFCPKHYLMQFHEKHADPEKMKKMIADSGFVSWVDFFMERMDLDRNPDLPVVSAYQIKVPYPASRCVAVRNPYYYKVDTAGNQLPYMDEMVTSMVFDDTVLNMKAMNGEADFQIRRINPSNFTLFKEKGRQLGYDVKVTPSTNPTCIYLNQYSRNEDMRKLLQDRRFRQALSLAINRDELIELIYSELAVKSSGFTIKEDPYYVKGLETANTEYDPAKANQLLDELGLKRRKSDGMRMLPNGETFAQVLHIYPSEEGTNADLWQLVVDYWREVGLQFAAKQEDATLSFLQATSGNSDFFTYANASLHWEIDGVWKAPISSMSYMAPLYGNYYNTDGKQGVKPPPEMQRLVDWYLGLRGTPDDKERMRLGQNILKQWGEECYVIGICRPPVVTVVSDRLKNVPGVVNYDYRLKSPGYLNPEQFFIEEEKTGAAR